MANYSEFKESLKEKVIISKSEIQLTPDPVMGEELNSKILEITMRIKNNYPELSKYIEEMPITIPNEEHPTITLKKLKTYLDSLNSILDQYLLEHPENIK